jgi:hypothetical protein
LIQVNRKTKRCDRRTKQEWQDRTGRTGQKIQDRITRTEQLVKDAQDLQPNYVTGRTGIAEQDSQSSTARIGLPDRITRTGAQGHPEEDSLDSAASRGQL